MRNKVNLEQLHSVITPIGINDFFENYYEKKFLLVKDRDRNFYNNILTVEDIDRVLELEQLDALRVSLIKDGEALDLAQWSSPNKKSQSIKIDAQKIEEKLNSGYSLVLNYFHEHQYSLLNFTQQLKEEFQANIWANIYITPASAKAFSKHYDTHDVFVLQIKGSKNWNLYETPIGLPDVKQNSSKQGIDYEKTTTLTNKFTLNAGDLLYIPRGLVHEASATNETSVHITIGIVEVKVKDVYSALEDKILENIFFRKSISAALKENESIDDLKQVFKNQLLKSIDSIEFKTLIEETQLKFSEQYIKSRPQKTITKMIANKNVNAETIISKRNEADVKFRQEGIFFILDYDEKSERFPIPLKDTIESIISDKKIKVKDIKGVFDLDKKIKIVHSFLNKKLIEIHEE